MKEFSNDAYYLIFSALANRTRLAIIDILRERPRTVSEIASSLGQEENVVSRSLEPLVRSALVLQTVSGKEKSYHLNKELMEPLSELLEFHVDKYCPGFEKCVPPEKLKEYLKAEAAKTMYIEHE